MIRWNVLFVSICAIAVNILLHWFDSTDSAKEREEKLESLVGEKSEVSVTPHGNEFTIQIKDIEVTETSSRFYKLAIKPLPFIGGFAGRTEVAANIDGEVRVEELVLIKEIIDSTDLIRKIADLRLDENELQLALNLVRKEEINEVMTKFRTMMVEGGEWIIGEVIKESDRNVLGTPMRDDEATFGIARPIVLDVAYPTSWVRKRVFHVFRTFANIIADMERGVVWARYDPHRNRKTARYRLRSPIHYSHTHELSLNDYWHMLTLQTDYENNHFLKIMYMGLGVRREFANENKENIVEVGEKKGLKLLLRQSGEKSLDNVTPSQTALMEHIANSLFIPINFSVPEGGQVFVPIFDFNPISNDSVHHHPKKKGEIDDLRSCINSTEGRVVATALTGLGNGVIQGYYRKSSYYFTVRWNENDAQVWEVGENDPNKPLDVEGIVLWHRLHPHRRTAYFGEYQEIPHNLD